MLYDAMRIWFQNGGRIETTDPESWKRELRSIYVQKTVTSKLQVMSKKEMARNKMKSPNMMDALSLSFVDDAWRIISGCYVPSPTQQAQANNQTQDYSFDRYSMIPSS